MIVPSLYLCTGFITTYNLFLSEHCPLFPSYFLWNKCGYVSFGFVHQKLFMVSGETFGPHFIVKF